MSKEAKLLLDLGVPPHILGFKYICDALELLQNDPSMIYRVTKELYPTIGKRNGSTGPRVERAMRHAIECLADRANEDEIRRVLGRAVGAGKFKPTNSEFLASALLALKDYE